MKTTTNRQQITLVRRYETPHIDQVQALTEGILCSSANEIDKIEYEFDNTIKE